MVKPGFKSRQLAQGFSPEEFFRGPAKFTEKLSLILCLKGKMVRKQNLNRLKKHITKHAIKHPDESFEEVLYRQ